MEFLELILAQLPDWAEHALAQAFIFVTIAAPLVPGLQSAARAWQAHAARTSGEWDDGASAKAVLWTGRLASAFDTALNWIPRLRIGGGK